MGGWDGGNWGPNSSDGQTLSVYDVTKAYGDGVPDSVIRTAIANSANADKSDLYWAADRVDYWQQYDAKIRG